MVESREQSMNDEWCGDCRRVVNGGCDAYHGLDGGRMALWRGRDGFRRCSECKEHGRPDPWWSDPTKPVDPGGVLTEMAKALMVQREAQRACKDNVCTTCRPRIPPRKDGV